MASSPNRNPTNRFGQPKDADHKTLYVRKTAKLERVDVTYGASLKHPNNLGLWEVSGVAGSAGCYSIDQYNLRPETFIPGQQFKFRLPLEIRNLDVIAEGMLAGWSLWVKPINETE